MAKNKAYLVLEIDFVSNLTVRYCVPFLFGLCDSLAEPAQFKELVQATFFDFAPQMTVSDRQEKLAIER